MLSFLLPKNLLALNNVDEIIIKELHRVTPHTEDLPQMEHRKVIRVLTTFSKSNFFIYKGQPIGFEYNMLMEYYDWLNKKKKYKTKDKVHMEFIPVPNDQLMPLLLEGRGDIAAAGLTITPEREKEVNFTNPYLWDVKELVVANKSVEGLKDLKSLSGREVGVRASSSYYESLQKLNAKFKKEGLKPVKIVEMDDYLGTEDILELVNAGVVSITIADDRIANLWTSVFKDLVVYEDIYTKKGGKIAWMVRKNNPELLASLNEFIKSHKKGTLKGNIYFNRFFKDDKWIKNPTNKEDMERFQKYVTLFKKYGKMYNIDWLLIAAQAYQESGLDHNKKSHAGAVGIMQIMPSLAKDKRIGITDIYSLEGNIHAGVKYMALIRDNYFKDGEVSDADRYRFSLAAYNAGPSRVIKSRKKAADMGYDNDIWFKNTELGVLSTTGREPVTYVSNINKYYIAYRMAMELGKAQLEKVKDMKK